MEEPKRIIKPLLAREIHLQNIQKYQNFIQRRYKTTLNFKFTCPEKPTHHAVTHDKKAQARALKAVKLLKFTKKVDLSGLNVRSSYIIPAKTFAIFRRVFKSTSVSALAFRPSANNGSYHFDEKWLRHLPVLRNFTYRLQIAFKNSDHPVHHARSMTHKKNPLRSLKYCPNIQFLKIQIPSYALPYLKSLYKFKSYPKSIKHLEIKPELHVEEPHSSIGCFKQLQSINLKFNLESSPSFATRNMQTIAKLSNLQEINLSFVEKMIPEVEAAFGEIAQKNNLKKFKLHFEHSVPTYEGVFRAITGKGMKLTTFSFSLKAFIADPQQLDPVAKFIKEMTQLECLKMKIMNQNPFYAANCFANICTEINQLPALRRLSLHFRSNDTMKVKNNPITLIPYLQNVFSKPIKLQALTMKSNQTHPSDASKNLIAALKDSKSSLQKFKVDLGPYSPAPQDYDATSSFIQGLENIRILDFPSLEIGTLKSLNEFVGAVYSFKYIRVLHVGIIKGTVTKPVFLDAVEAIVKKRGLRSFHCSIKPDFMKSLIKVTKGAPKINLDKVQKLNPALERIPSLRYVFDEASGDALLN